MISIIIRTKNEERWISKCLKAIQAQQEKDIEVILVDNASTDETVAKAIAMMPDIKIIEIPEFLPGRAINEGIRASRGEYIAILSAHCIPVNNKWLHNLKANLNDSNIAGVYGRQTPVAFTPDQDKRDLLITFGLDKRIQIKDSFFHNANSMILRSTWQKFPFDENATNIEDRLWGKEVIKAGKKIIYEPEAVVSHHHGIHQSNNKERMINTVKILDEIGLAQSNGENPADPQNMEICAIVPLQYSKKESIDVNHDLISRTLASINESNYITRKIISTDSTELIKYTDKWNMEIPFLRPPSLSKPSVRADDVLKFTLNELENQGYFPDLIVALEITHPFRPVGLLDKLIKVLCYQNFDSVVSGYPEYRPCWMENNGQMNRIDKSDIIRLERIPINIGLFSLGCVAYPDVIRNGSRIGKRVGIYEVDNPLSNIEIRCTKDLQLFKMIQQLEEQTKNIQTVNETTRQIKLNEQWHQLKRTTNALR